MTAKLHEYPTSFGSKYGFRLPTMRDRTDAMALAEKNRMAIRVAAERGQQPLNVVAASFETFLAAKCLQTINGATHDMAPETLLADESIDLVEFSEFDAFLTVAVFGDEKMQNKIANDARTFMENLRSGKAAPAPSGPKS